MDHAILLAAGTGIDGEQLGLHAKTVIAGVPQLKRLIITAERTGIKRFTVILESGNDGLKETLKNEKRITSEIAWHPAGSPIEFEQKPSLILQSNLIINPSGLSTLVNCEVRNDEAALLVDEFQDAWVKTAEGEGELKTEDYFSRGGRAVGAFVACGSLLEKSISDSMILTSWAKELVGRGSLKSVKLPGDGYWTRLSSDKASVKKAEDLLFSRVGKTATGWISRSINSKVSLPTSRLLVRTPLTPNMISVLLNVIGALCGPFYALGHPVLGALFLEIATILDRCDGEVARVKLMETKRGQWVDTISDQFTVLSFLIGVPVGYYLISKNPLAIILGSVNISIFIFFVVWSFYFLVKYTDSGSLVSYFNVDDVIADKKPSLIRRFITIIRPLSRRNVYALAFLALAIAGGYPWVLGVTTVALVFFLIHQIEDMIKLKKLKPARLE